jgi:glutamine synthetase
MRSEMLSVMAEMGLTVEKHHHEVAACPARAGHEVRHPDPHGRQDADLQVRVHQVAHAYGKTATFMPKPVFGDNGSGMHVHQSIWKGGKPTFAGDEYAGLSEPACSTSAASSSTPRPQRLHQPVDQLLQASGSGLRSTGSAGLLGAQPFGLLPYSVRLLAQGQARRSPLWRSDRQPVPGLRSHADGRHRRHQEQDPPGRGHGQGPLRPAAKELKKIPTVAGSLREALESLDKDRKFLTAGGVFDDDQIDAFIELKMEEVMRFEMTPHPVEFDMYYSV